ncbi:multinuclear nonheme iron-dependent oxidase [Sorangium sp. So ce124]|uniref:multinuclear nonheme iron-dependent oxidase n=1 Tax=Sorangium sp. So ce124 TaxID=3133280 RepID=UPI003F63849F
MAVHIGMSYHPELHDLLWRARDEGLVDFLEIQPERYIYSHFERGQMKRLLSDFGTSYCFHFACNSLGSADYRLDRNARQRRDIVNRLAPRWCSDHMTSCRIGDFDLEKNLPLLRTDETLQILVENIKLFQEGLAAPFLLENIATMWELKRSTIAHDDFFARAVEMADCGILLDLHNLYADQLNHGLDPRAFIDRMPAHRIRQLHLAGGTSHDGYYYDGHDHEVPQVVFELLEYLLARVTPEAVILEREARFKDLPRVWDDLVRIRRMCQR